MFTNHFSPILQRLLTGSKYRDVDVVRFDNGSIGFHLLFRDKEAGHFADNGNLRLEFKLHSVEQIEGTVRWLVGYLQPGVPKVPIRLYADGIEEVRLINVIESHWAITHFGFCLSSDPGATWPSPILPHLAQPAASGWPLPDLEVFVYAPGPQDEVMLDMLRRRYGQGSGEPDSGRLVPRPLRRVRIEPHQAQGGYLAGEVGRILPQAEIFLMENYKGSIWSL
ncbi:hypothetical protein FRC01_010991 [Tulasnella sp. 417]|nr:hypothetical protein FRC01_010991 [Tulasnella sp. 417]